MLDALAEAVLEGVRKQYRKKGRREGEAGEGWVVIDYNDVVVHIFSPDQREYYSLEELWREGKVVLHLQ